jgi:cell division septation protein DedD
MAENRRDRDKRFYFSRGQLVLLAGAFTLASLAIFYLGIVIGRGIEERKVARPDEPLVKIPVKPSAQGGGAAVTGQGREELTFYDTLTKSSGKESSLETRVNESKQPANTSKSETHENKSAGSDKSSSGSVSVEEKPDPEKPNTRPSSPADVRESDKTWYVQVNAFPDEKSGKVWVDRLKNKGYKAYLTEARNQGKLWYRVRVGQYSSHEEAERMADILRTKENFPNAFATRQ